MTNEALEKRARELGFDRVWALRPVYAPRRRVHRLNENVADDPETLAPGTQTVILLLKGYAPYREAAENGRGAMISAYYAASNQAYAAAKALARELREEGWHTLSGAQIAIKPMMAQYGLGLEGYNTLIAVDGLGSRFHAQVILTDAPFAREPLPEVMCTVDERCRGCRACAKACPAGAISDTGVDIEKCLRARSEGEFIPPELRPLYENRLLGCEICQNACLRNACETREMPADVSESLELGRLLRGDLGALADEIGRNYARKTRIRVKAAMLAGNLRRADCMEELKELLRSDSERESEMAAWAIRQIEGKETT